MSSEPENKGRILGSAIVALGSLFALCAAAAAIFFTIASLLRSEWLFAILGVGVFLVVYWALTRLLRVSANRSSAALKAHKQKNKSNK